MSRNKKVRQATFDKPEEAIESEPAVEEIVETPAAVEESVPVEEPVEEPVVEEEPVAEPEPVPEPTPAQPVVEEPKPAEKPKAEPKPEPKKAEPVKKGERKSAVVCTDGGKALIIIDAAPETIQAKWDAAKKTTSAAKFFKALQDEYGVRPITSYKGVSLVLPVTMGLRPNLADADYVELR